MVIFDTINDLETYVNIVPNLDKSIGILDRSLPYELFNDTKITDGVKYKVESYVASSEGYYSYNDNLVLILTLDGRQMITSDNNVFVLNEGSFVILDKPFKKGIAIAEGESIKDCVFILS